MVGGLFVGSSKSTKAAKSATVKAPKLPYRCEWVPALTNTTQKDLSEIVGKVAQLKIRGTSDVYLVHAEDAKSYTIEKLTREYNRYRRVQIPIGGKREEVEDVFLIKENPIEVVQKRDCGFLSISQVSCPSFDPVTNQVPIVSRPNVVKYTAYEKSLTRRNKGIYSSIKAGVVLALAWRGYSYPGVKDSVGNVYSDFSNFRVTGVWGKEQGDAVKAVDDKEAPEKQSSAATLMSELGTLVTPAWGKLKDGIEEIPSMFSGKDAEADKSNAETPNNPESKEAKPAPEEKKSTEVSKDGSSATEKTERTNKSEGKTLQDSSDGEVKTENKQTETSKGKGSKESQSEVNEEEPKNSQEDGERQAPKETAEEDTAARSEREGREALQKNQGIWQKKLEKSQQRLKFPPTY